jgi:hypothetical protein
MKGLFAIKGNAKPHINWKQGLRNPQQREGKN